MDNSINPLRMHLLMQRGATLRRRFRFPSTTRAYREITGIANSAPCRITAAGHGVPEGWPVAISGVTGMVEINKGDPNAPQSCDFYRASPVDSDTLELENVNAAGFKAYKAGGVLMYYEPVDMADMTGTAMFFAADSDANPALETEVSIDNADKAIDLVVTDEETAALALESGTWRIELASGDDVIRFVCGSFTNSYCGC